VTRWRQRHGGPGIPLPEALWAEAVEVAETEGVGVTARALRVDRWRLAARMAAGPGDAEGAIDAEEAIERFVEVDTSRLYPAPPRIVIRFVGRDGGRVEVELGDATSVDVVALAHAFWERQR
jgi:hypothetical protein